MQLYDRAHHTAVDAQRRARRGRRLRAAHIGDHRGDLGRRGEASYDRARPRGCEEFALHRRDIDAARCGELLDERAHARRRGRPGQHAVDRDAGALQRLRQPARDCELRGLGDAVMNHLRGYLPPGLTRYEHDASPAAGAHVLHEWRARRTLLITLVSKNRNQSASLISVNGFGSMMPRLLTRISTVATRAMSTAQPSALLSPRPRRSLAPRGPRAAAPPARP